MADFVVRSFLTVQGTASPVKEWDKKACEFSMSRRDQVKKSMFLLTKNEVMSANSRYFKILLTEEVWILILDKKSGKQGSCYYDSLHTSNTT